MSDCIVLTVGPGQPDNIEFGEILEDFRTSNRFSRAEAAKRIGVSSEYVRVIERGDRTPALGTALKILDIYEVSCIRHKSQIEFKNFSVKFISRIKERRHRFLELKVTRNEMIGQIVGSLVVADDNTLRKVHKILN